MKKAKSKKIWALEIEKLKMRQDVTGTIQAIRRGNVAALEVSGLQGEHLLSLVGAASRVYYKIGGTTR